MLWAVIILALMIPLAAVILDSPVVRAFVDRARGQEPAASAGADVRQLVERVQVLEAELEDVRGQLKSLTDGQQFVQRLLENPAARTGQGPNPPA